MATATMSTHRRRSGSAARKVSATIEPAVLEEALKGLRLSQSMGDIPTVVMDTLDAAVDAYVKGRRNPAALSRVLTKKIPAITRTLDAYIRVSLRNSIEWASEDIRKYESCLNPTQAERETAESAEKILRADRAVWQWLYGKGDQ